MEIFCKNFQCCKILFRPSPSAYVQLQSEWLSAVYKNRKRKSFRGERLESCKSQSNWISMDWYSSKLNVYDNDFDACQRSPKWSASNTTSSSFSSNDNYATFDHRNFNPAEGQSAKAKSRKKLCFRIAATLAIILVVLLAAICLLIALLSHNFTPQFKLNRERFHLRADYAGETSSPFKTLMRQDVEKVRRVFLCTEIFFTMNFSLLAFSKNG